MCGMLVPKLESYGRNGELWISEIHTAAGIITPQILDLIMTHVMTANMSAKFKRNFFFETFIECILWKSLSQNRNIWQNIGNQLLFFEYACGTPLFDVHV